MSLAKNEKVVWTGKPTIIPYLIFFPIGLPLWFFIAWGTHYSISNMRVYAKSGIISKKTKEATLEKITDVNLKQGWLGRLLGYGDLIINTAGTGGYEIVLSSITSPGKVRDMLNNASSQFSSIDRIQDRIDRLEDRYLLGEITREQFERAKKELESRK